jgi:hypothetical protein
MDGLGRSATTSHSGIAGLGGTGSGDAKTSATRLLSICAGKTARRSDSRGSVEAKRKKPPPFRAGLRDEGTPLGILRIRQIISHIEHSIVLYATEVSELFNIDSGLRRHLNRVTAAGAVTPNLVF